MNNFKNDTERMPRQSTRRRLTRGCEPLCIKLSSPLLSSFSSRHFVADGDTTCTFIYHADGQLASANYGETSESFLWDGLALVKRGEASFINEPHIGGGNPVVSSTGTSYFNDMLGTTVGTKSGKKYSAAALTAFGEGTDADKAFFTGKPMVEGLGHTFLFRNYRASLAKWQTADPLGYPDGWNRLAYCNGSPIDLIDYEGGYVVCEYSITSRIFTMIDGAERYVVRAISGDNVVSHQWELLGPAPIGSWSIINDPKETYFQLWYDEDKCFDDVAKNEANGKRRQNIRLTVNSISHGCVCLEISDESYDIIRLIKATSYVMKRSGADNEFYRCYGQLTITE